MYDMHLVIVWPKVTKPISHIDQPSGVGRCQTYATRPRFLDNLPYWGEHFVKSVINHRLNFSTKTSPQLGEIEALFIAAGPNRVVLFIMKSASKTDACHSSPVFRQSPPLGRTIRKTCQPQFQVEIFDELFAPMQAYATSPCFRQSPF